MNVFGIIAEYNPFHNGHKFQLEMARNLGATHIVAIMSPNFTQRGEPSITDKFHKAKAAVKSGIDLVLELPTIYALSSAEIFAFGGIYILDKLQIIDNLIFGAETDNVKILENIVECLESDIFKKKLIEILKQGYSFPKSRQIALENFIDKKITNEIEKPNNILAIEYLKWLRRLKSNINPVLIKRWGAIHDKKDISENVITSALNLRDMIKEKRDIEIWKKFVPSSAYEVYKEAFIKGYLPSFEKNGERAVISKLRSIDIDDIKMIPDISEGIENRIFKSIRNFSSLNEIYNDIKTKRYTMSRVRRAIYNLYLDLKSEYLKFLPQYIRVLAINKRGTEILSEIKRQNIDICVDNNLNRLSKINKIAQLSAEIEIKATNMYSLFGENILPCNIDLTHKFEID